jgi:fatty-acid peroxygenase
MSQIQREKCLDGSLALLSEGYTFFSKRCERYRTDAFETRLMLRKVICVKGEEAARMFYHPDRFTRKAAIPPNTLLLLQDLGSVMTKDGEAHRHRKHMFMSLMSPERIQHLAELMADQWRAHVRKWEQMGNVVLHDEVQEIICRAICQWSGVPLEENEAEQRTRELAAMIEGAGSFGPRNWRGLLLRSRTERWVRGVIDRIRAGKLNVPEGSAAHVLAWHRELDGKLLDTKSAAVELINVLRPTVAVARYVTFAALALHEHPETRQRLQSGEDGEYLDWFVQEVRRFYPFFPAVGGRVKNEFEWRGHHFTQGTWVLLDLYGTNHDARSWEEPEAFRPERFRHWDGSAFNLIPQGGGDHHHGHRCPGEWITIELMKTAVRLLTLEMQYDVPKQDLSIDLSRMPALPESRFVISNVRRAYTADHASRTGSAPASWEHSEGEHPSP